MARDAWQRSAGKVESYRMEFNVDDSRAMLGGRPREAEQMIAWREAQLELGFEREMGRGL
jgi:hypothetical protein